MSLNANTRQRLAHSRVMQDLIDCLWAEAFFDDEITRLEPADAWTQLHQLDESRPTVEWPAHERTWRWQPSHSRYRSVLVAARPGVAQPWQSLFGAPVYAITRRDQLRRLDVPAFMSLVTEALGPRMPGSGQGAAQLLETLNITLRQTEWSYAHRIDHRHLLTRPPSEFFQVMEQWGALRDRPYHPVAKAKVGLERSDYHYYVAEFDQAIPLHWVAIRRDHLVVGEGVVDPQGPGPADYLLNSDQATALEEELSRRGLDGYLAVPILAWQLQRGLPKALHEDAGAGHWVRLDFQGPRMKSTSSVRSMAPLDNSPNYLKLPMSVYSLGSSRYLPAVKMMNGVIAENLLRKALPLDPVLANQIHLCDETLWWAYMPKHGSLFDDAPRHLSAMVRRYPAALIKDPDCRLIPMSALGTHPPDSRAHFFDEWMAYRGLATSVDSVLTLFREICDRFLVLSLRLFRLGIVPEIHGQNAVLMWRRGRIDGLLLRDHDSLRLYVPWLHQVGLSDPVFRLKKGVANTLYHDTAEDLLFYLLTLGIQVNLRAIIDALSVCYRLDERRLWRELSESLEQAIELPELGGEAKDVLQRVCFDADTWPQKLLLRPLLERAGGPGSMPFGKSRVPNPLKRLSAGPVLPNTEPGLASNRRKTTEFEI